MKHLWLPIVVAMLSGMIVGLPHLFIPRWIAPELYDPLQFTYGKGSSITMEEIYTYAPEVREILDGSTFVNDSQVYEYRNSKTPFIGETVPAWIVAIVSRMSGSIENGFVVSDFLFPFVTALLVYALARRLSSSRGVSAATAATVVLWSELIALIPYPQAIGTSFLEAFHPRDFLIMSRSFHPQVSLPLFLLAVFLVMVAIRKKQWPISVLAGIAGGALFYSYVFSWTAFVGGLGILGVFVVLTRRWENVRHLLIIIGIALLVGFPYFDSIRMFRQGESSVDFFQKLSLPKRGFVDLIARHIIFLGLYIIVRRKRWTTDDWCFLAFWIAPIVLPNLSQEILGRDLEGKHWVRRLAYPMSAIGLGIVAAPVLQRKLLNIGAVCLFTFVVLRGAILQYSMAKQSADTYRTDTEKRELFEWINRNTEPGTVIASLDWDVIASLPAKTHAFNFAPIGMRTVASTDETIERYLWTYALFGASREAVDFSFSDPTLNGQSGIAVSRAVYFLYAQPDKVFTLPPKIKTDILNHYDATATSVRFAERPPLRLDYLLLRSFEKQIEKNDDIAMNPALLVFRNASFELYQYPMLQSGE